MIEFEHTIFILLLLTAVLNAKPPKQHWATVIILIGVLLFFIPPTTYPHNRYPLGFSLRVSDPITPVAEHLQNRQRGLAGMEKCCVLGDRCADFFLCPVVWWRFELGSGFAVWRDGCQHDLESRRTREWVQLHEPGGAAHADFPANRS